MVTEVKPKMSFQPTINQQLKINGYEIYTNFDHTIVTRGIEIYVNERLTPFIAELDIESSFQESLWLSLKLQGNDSLTLGCIYHSPSSLQTNNQDLRNLIPVAAKYSSHILIAGDFNYPDINWNTITTTRGEDHDSQLFIDTVRDVYLHQHLTDPTRHRYGQNQNTLDLILTNEEDIISNVTTYVLTSDRKSVV